MVEQAISLHIARTTGVWDFSGIATTEPIRDVKPGDIDDVGKCLSKITREDALWRQYFRDRAIEPMFLCYEDFAADQPTTIREIASFLNLDASTFRIPLAEADEKTIAPRIALVRRRLASTFDSRTLDGAGDSPASW